MKLPTPLFSASESAELSSEFSDLLSSSEGKTAVIVIGAIVLLLVLVTFYAVSKCRSGILNMLEYDEGYEEREREFEARKAAEQAEKENREPADVPPASSESGEKKA